MRNRIKMRGEQCPKCGRYTIEITYETSGRYRECTGCWAYRKYLGRNWCPNCKEYILVDSGRYVVCPKCGYKEEFSKYVEDYIEPLK
jgi:ribosomal protein S27AE